ncbi:MAG: CehA/McbA family metallohydrolase [Planctomycetota bacterium]
MRSTVWLLFAVPLVAWLALPALDDVAPLAGEPGPTNALLRFEVRERAGGPLPARLTFVPAGSSPGAPAPVFDAAHWRAAPGELAVRANVVYTRTGQGAFTVPAGKYTVYASKGLEWSLAAEELELAGGSEASFTAELTHELDTQGWIGADFHLHTLTHSGHGDADLAERLLSFPGEGLELAVATDHDHHTDYAPTARALGLADTLATVVGNEVTTPIGHFNAFPLDPAAAPVDSSLTDANELFRRVRAQVDPAGTVPVIQLNHPRLDGIDFFTQTGLDPVTGKSASASWSRDFDAIEILNENLALGFDDPLTTERDTHGHSFSARDDWYHLLNRGGRPAAVGNSDSHHVQAIVAGYPRNFVRVADDSAPAGVSSAALAAAVRAKQLFTTTGPFVEFSVEGVAMGGEARARDGHALVKVRVTAASWVDTTRLSVIVDGELERTLAIPPGRATPRLAEELELCLAGTCARHGQARADIPAARDAWVALIVEGDAPRAPVLRAGARPLALTNPVWIDGDGDGRWTSPLERVAAALRAQRTPDLTQRWFDTLTAGEQALALGEVARGPYAGTMIPKGLASKTRAVRLAAARAAERVGLPATTPALQTAWRANADDPFLGVLLTRVLVAGDRALAGKTLAALIERFGHAALRRYAGELLPLFEGGVIAEWSVLGPLPLDAQESSRSGRPPLCPLTRAEPRAPTGEVLAWRGRAPGRNGYVDLVGLNGLDTDGALVLAHVWLESPDTRTVLMAFGSDDAGRVWLGGQKLYENLAAKSANPLEALIEVPLSAGWNRLILEIENGRGGFGFHARLLDPAVRTSTQGP